MLSHLCNETGCNNYDCSICMFNETVAKANMVEPKVVEPKVVTPIKTEYNKAPHINDCNEYQCDECPFEAYCR